MTKAWHQFWSFFTNLFSAASNSAMAINLISEIAVANAGLYADESKIARTVKVAALTKEAEALGITI